MEAFNEPLFRSAGCQPAFSPIANWYGVETPSVQRFGHPRYSAARQSRNHIVFLFVLALDCSTSDYENEEEDEAFAQPATIWTDACRQAACATRLVSLQSRLQQGA